MTPNPPTEDRRSLPVPWGDLALEPGGSARLELGPLTIWMQRTQSELTIASLVGADPLAAAAEAVNPADTEPPGEAKRARWILNRDTSPIRLMPALADRPVVVRPEQPLMLLAGDEAVVYVGSQLFVRIEAGSPTRQLVEWPTYRLSDTWFGASTRSGELCYASRTRARTSREDIPIRPARALTRLQVKNRGTDPLLLERIKVPVGHLALHVGEDGRFWTQSLLVQRSPDEALVEVQIQSTPPAEAGQTTFVAAARTTVPGVVQRALEALIG